MHHNAFTRQFTEDFRSNTMINRQTERTVASAYEQLRLDGWQAFFPPADKTAPAATVAYAYDPVDQFYLRIHWTKLHTISSQTVYNLRGKIVAREDAAGRIHLSNSITFHRAALGEYAYRSNGYLLTAARNKLSFFGRELRYHEEPIIALAINKREILMAFPREASPS